ncbi:YD repeat-containing protein [Novosphingobium sp. CF614]|uniref:LysM peptidoglycan-binding domain-containing protein n=1 Tax=Novosphingobium sp. CF614 TaxID=1884364 RepID=UPI0008F06AB2|nr:LysM peptidoglycan-binding domain-containing protein [Novosphingobium sp. CF614]SFG52018.1 YD repeat-containing protein [Novosphingobium sp. CF614]
MVSVVTGSGLGLDQASGFVLGSRGQLGSSAFGRYGEGVTVNAATGNLFVNRTDEILIGLGVDAVVSRSYNSLGLSNDENGDNWQLGGQRRVAGLTGTVNTAGSTVTRYDWDGSSIAYTWDASKAAYVSAKVGHQDDRITFASNVWTWTDSDSRTSETYDHLNGGRLIAVKDADNNTTSYSYTGSLLTRIATANGEYTDLTWSGSNLTQVVTTKSSGTPLTRVRYTYDDENRLWSVTTDLTPDDNSVADGKTVVTTYTYDGTSDRVASISQTGGAKLDFTYALVGADYRVATYKQTLASGVTSQVTLSYDTTNRVTTLTDQSGQVTKLTYDTSSRLTKVELPPAQAGATAQVTTYTYDSAGNVLTMKDALNNTTAYQYDANGNLTLIRDAAANTVTYTYGAGNELLTETRYTVADPDGSGPGLPSGSATTRYVYDTAYHLLFTITAEGGVTQNAYFNSSASNGLLRFQWAYTGQVYDTSGLTDIQAPSAADLNTWISAITDKSTRLRTEYTYDFRGNLATAMSWGASTSAGAGSGVATTVTYTYDQYGNLLTRQTSGIANTEVFTYDGLGRMTGSVDLDGGTTSLVFTDGQNRQVVTLANGLVQTSTYNMAGQLISYQTSGTGLTTATASYKYDTLGRQRIAVDALSNKSYALYDATGRKVAAIAADGAITEYFYDAGNRLVATLSYATRVAADRLALLVDANGNPTDVSLGAIRPNQAAGDAWEWRVYDKADRLLEVIDGQGGVSRFGYDGMSNLVRTVQYRNVLSSSTLAGLKERFSNRLYNPQFNGAGGWTTGTDAAGIINNGSPFTAVWTGKSLIRSDFTATDAGQLASIFSGWDHLFNATAGEQLVVQAGVEGVGPVASLELVIWWTDANGATIGQSLIGQLAGAQSFNTKVGSTVTVPTGAVAGRLELYMTTSAAGSGWISLAEPVVLPANSQSTLTVVAPGAFATKDEISRNFYDKSGRLVGALDGLGYLSQVVYDAGGRAVHTVAYANLTDATLRAAGTFADLLASVGTNTRDIHQYSIYYNDGKLRYTLDANLRPTEYAYDAAGNLIHTIDYGASIGTGTDYSASYVAGQISSLGLSSNANTRKSWSVYDNAGRLAYAINAEGGVSRFSYDSLGQITKTVQFALIRTTTSDPTLATMDAWASTNGIAGDRVTRSYYDRRGLRYVVDAEGFLTRNDYDLDGKLTRTFRWDTAYAADDTTTIDTINAANKGTWLDTQYAYDPLGRLSTTTDALGIVTKFIYDALDRVTDRTVAYGAVNGGGTSAAVTTHYVYDAAGRVTDETAAWGTADATTTHYTYDGFGHVLTRVSAYGAAEASTTVFTYDALGNVLTQVAASGTSVEATTSFAYDAFGNVIATTDARGNVSYSTYDLLNRLVWQVDAEGYVTQTSYTIGDEVASITRYHARATVSGPAVVPTVAATSGEDATTTFTRDKLGRVTKVTDAMGAYEQYTLDAFGNRLTVKNKLGGTTTNTFDRRGLLLTETLPISSIDNEGNVAAASVTNSYAYDSRGNRTQMVEAVGLSEQRTTTYTYDKMDRLTKTTGMAVGYASDTSLGATGSTPLYDQVTYDKRGNVIESKNAAGNRTLFYYDGLNRKIAEISPVGTLSTWTYDDNGNAISARVYGDAVSLPGTAGGTAPAPVNASNYRETTFTYDRANRLLTSTVVSVQIGYWNGSSYVTSTPSLTVTNQYDKAGNVIKQTDARGYSVYFFYDKLGRKVGQADKENYFTAYTLDADGNVTQETRYAIPVTSTITAGGNPPAINLIPNGDFSQGLTGWTIGYDPNNILKAGSPYTITNVNGTGTNCIKAEFNATAAGQTISLATTTNVPVVAGDRLAVQMGIEGQGAGIIGTQTVAVWFFDANGNTIPNTGGGIASLNGPLSYNTKLGGFVDVPQGAASMRLELYMDSAGAGQGTFLIDQPMVASVPRGQTQLPSFSANAGGVAGLAGARTTQFTYDRNGRRLTEKRLNVTAWTIDGSTGLLTAASTTATVTYTYNGLGEVTKKTEATGEYTDYFYDTMGRQTSIRSSAFTDYTATSVKRQTEMTYDGLGNLTSTSERGVLASDNVTSSGQSARVTTYSYDAAGRLVSTYVAGGATHFYEYDIAGRLIRDRYLRANSAGTTTWEASDTRYDAAGRVIKQAVRSWNGSSWTTPAVETRIAYNTYGEVTGQGTNAGSAGASVYQETFSYDAAGRIWRSTAGDGVVKLYLYDQNGNQSAVITSDGDALPSGYSWSTLTIQQAITLFTNSGASTIGNVSVQGMVVTLQAYDKRGSLTQTREPQRDVSATGTTAPASTLINHQKVYNAFGEVVQEINARGYVSDYTYNTMGKVIQRQMPTVSWTAENGAQANARPTENYYYDLSGRVVGVQDANGNLNTKSLLAGTGYGGSEALTLTEFHADTGKFYNKYDIFNDLRTTVNEVGKSESYNYDNRGLLVSQVHQQRADGTQLIDFYSYDALGHRLTHYNSQLGSTVKDITDYDALGRIISMIDMGGNNTSYEYAWDQNQATTGLGTFGATIKTTTNAAGKYEVVWTDYFGRTVDKWDYGRHDYNYTYNIAGQLANTTNAAGLSTTYTYYNTGLIASISTGTDNGYSSSTATSTFRYNAEGNRTLETHAVTGYYYDYYDGIAYDYTTSYENATATYDALNRITAITDTGTGSAAPITIAYEYDLVGNIRHMNASFRFMDTQGVISSASSTQDYWYKYDAMNRFVTTKGVFTGTRGSGSITRGTAGGLGITYDLAGNRATSIWTERASYTILIDESTGKTKTMYKNLDHSDQYIYETDGYLKQVNSSVDAMDIDGIVTQGTMTKRAAYTRDAMGRVTDYKEYASNGTSVVYERSNTYNTKSQVTSDIVTSVRSDGTWVSNSTYYYNASETSSGSGEWTGVTSGGTYMGGVVTKVATSVTKNGAAQTGNTTTYSYRWWDNALQSKTNYVSGSTSNTSTFYYSNGGVLNSVYIQDGRPRTVSFINNADGFVMSRDENDNKSTGDPRELHYYYNGHGIGDVSNNGTSDVDYVTSIAQHTAVGATGPFHNGATTSTNYADFDQSYDPINGLNYESTSSRYTVHDGDSLETIAQNLWGDASFWYLIADANGLNGSEILVAGQNLIIPNKVHNSHNTSDTYRVYDPNEAIGDTSPTAAKPPKKNKCGVFGQILLVAIAVAVTVVTSGAAAAAAANVSGGVFGGLGALASAGTAGGMTLGTAVAIGAGAAALGSVVSQGFGVATGIQDSFSWKGVALSALAGGIGTGLGGVNLFGTQGIGAVGSAAFRGVLGNALTQGIGVATGLQNSFSWSGVAAAGVGAGVGNAIGGHTALGRAGSGMAGGIAGAAATSLVTGRDFGDTIMSQLPSIIGNTIGNLVADRVAGKPETMAERLQRQGYKLLGQFADSGAIRSDAPSPEQQAWAEQAADEIVVTGHKMNWLEKLAYDVGHLFSGGSVRQTAPSSDRGTRFYWNYQAARQYHQQEASQPGNRPTVSDQQIWNNAYRQAGSQVNREFGGRAAFGPVSAATAIAAPVVLGNSLLAQGGTAFLTSANGGVATRYAMGQDISLETYALDGAVGTATFGVFKGVGAGGSAIASRFAAPIEESVPSRLIGSYLPSANLKFGSTLFGDEAHTVAGRMLTENLNAQGVPLEAITNRTGPGLTGIDMSVDPIYAKQLGFEHIEIKPNTANGLRTLNRQVERWGMNPSSVQSVTYDAQGNVWWGFDF